MRDLRAARRQIVTDTSRREVAFTATVSERSAGSSIEEIRRLFFAEHWKMGTIAAELGVHRDTVALAPSKKYPSRTRQLQVNERDPAPQDWGEATLERARPWSRNDR